MNRPARLISQDAYESRHPVLFAVLACAARRYEQHRDDEAEIALKLAARRMWRNELRFSGDPWWLHEREAELWSAAICFAVHGTWLTLRDVACSFARGGVSNPGDQP